MPDNPIVDALESPGMQWAFAGIGALLLLTLLREIPRIPRRLLVLMAAAFLDMVGLLMIVPLLPYYVKRMAGGGTEVLGLHLGAATLVGVVAAAFTVAQLTSAPLWGRFSDRHGRRPALLCALGASAAAYVVFGFAESLPVLLLSRLMQGAGGGTVGVIQAYVADTTPPAQRARALGWLSAATNLGVALGPVLGSQAVGLSRLSWWSDGQRELVAQAAPGVLAAALCLLTMAFAARFLRESNERSGAAVGRAPIGFAARRICRRPLEPASRLILIYAISIGAFAGTTSQLALYADHRFGIDEHTIGYVFLWIGAISVFARVLLLGRLVDRLGEARLAPIGLTLLAVGLVSFPFAASLPTLAVTLALLPLGTAFTFPGVTALLSRVVTRADRGMYLGLQQTFGGVARIAMPLLCGLAFDSLGPGSVFFVSAGFVLASMALGAGLASAVPRSGHGDASD